MKTVSTPKAPAAIGPYSQAKISGGLVFVSGQIPVDPATGSVAEGGIAAQCHQAIQNALAVLEAAGSSAQQVIKTTCFLTDLSDFGTFNEIYAQYFPGRPARSCVQVAALPKGVCVELEAVAETD